MKMLCVSSLKTAWKILRLTMRRLRLKLRLRLRLRHRLRLWLKMMVILTIQTTLYSLTRGMRSSSIYRKRARIALQRKVMKQ